MIEYFTSALPKKNAMPVVKHDENIRRVVCDIRDGSSNRAGIALGSAFRVEDVRVLIDVLAAGDRFSKNRFLQLPCDGIGFGVFEHREFLLAMD